MPPTPPMPAFPSEGYRDLRRRLRVVWLWMRQWRVRRDLAAAETELGWLAWEQVDFYDEASVAEVRKIQEFERTQAELYNTSAELGGRAQALDEELAREQAAYDAAQAALEAEREPVAASLGQQEAAHRQKVQAIARFDRAVEEISAAEKELEAASLAFMEVPNPGIQVRIEARKISDELIRLAGERKLVLADKATAEGQAAMFEAGIARGRAELRRIAEAREAAGQKLSAALRRISQEKRSLDRERRKSTVRMSRLDSKKRGSYRFIGGCLASHGIAPLNQPAALEKTVALREREWEISEALAALRTECAAADARQLAAFYVGCLILAVAVAAITHHLA
jgi:hypothetical protein